MTIRNVSRSSQTCIIFALHSDEPVSGFPLTTASCFFGMLQGGARARTSYEQKYICVIY